MTCVTCEITPPPGHSLHTGIATHLGDRHPGHISARWATPSPILFGTHVIWRGRNVTAQIIEAMPGDQHTGWIETYLLDDQGAPRIHPARYLCANDGCQHDTAGWAEWPRTPEEAEADPDGVGACPKCESTDPPRKLFDDHPITVIRTGPVTVITGTTIHTG